MKLAIITGGFLPVPATKGGAVENLIENFLYDNEDKCHCNITVFSDYDKDAVNESRHYSNSNFVFIKSNIFISILDKMIFLLSKYILRKKNSHSYRFIIKRLHFLRKVSKYLKINDYDKILLENHPTLYLSLKWNKNYKKYSNKYYYHCHNEFPATYGCRNIIYETNKIICVSEFRKNNVKKYLNLNDNKFSVVRNGIDVKKINKKVSNKERDELLKKYKINKNEKILIYTGRIVPEKGVKELLEAVKITKNMNYKLLILGSALNSIREKTQYQVEIENIVKNINDRVIFTGFINYDQLYKYYNIADLAIFPSICDDSAPLTVIEALVCGLPIITTNSGGIPEYVNDKCACILEKNNNLIENIARSIDIILEDDKKLKEMSKESIKLSKNLTLDVYCNNLFNEISGD